METRNRVWARLITFSAAFAASTAMAVPAAPGLHSLRQPDGSVFQARQWGDERVHGWETADGHSVVQDKSQGAWSYAVRDASGALVASPVRVGAGRAPAEARNLRPSADAIARIAKRTNSRQQQFMQAMNAGTPPSHAIPTTGTGHLLTILVNFNDTTTTNTPGEFTTLIYGAAGTKSVNDHYLEMSYGNYTLTGQALGWYTAANTHNYYGTNVSGSDAHPASLVYEAVAALEAAIPAFNWAPYDQDGDCYVDSLSVVHQGPGEEETGATTDIWSHSWNLASAQAHGDGPGAYATHTACSRGGYIMVNNYVIQPERSGSGMITPGVFSHEYGHALGLPDLYDTDYSSEGVGNWSLMAAGSWNYVTNPGDSPAHMDPWSKYALGWITPVAVSGTLTSEPIDAASGTADVYRIGVGDASSGEYFLIENRQRTGFDEGLPGAGLLIWHVDASVSTYDNTDNASECIPGSATINCTQTRHYKVALVQADNFYHLESRINRGCGTDPFYAGNKAGFDANTTPNSRWYGNTDSGASVTSVSTSGPTMTATLTFDPVFDTAEGTGSGGGTIAPLALLIGAPFLLRRRRMS